MIYIHTDTHTYFISLLQLTSSKSLGRFISIAQSVETEIRAHLFNHSGVLSQLFFYNCLTARQMRIKEDCPMALVQYAIKTIDKIAQNKCHIPKELVYMVVVYCKCYRTLSQLQIKFNAFNIHLFDLIIPNHIYITITIYFDSELTLCGCPAIPQIVMTSINKPQIHSKRTHTSASIHTHSPIPYTNCRQKIGAGKTA